MKLVPFFNDTEHVVFMGGVMVPAGDTRLVDARLLVVEDEPVSAGLDAEAGIDLEALLHGNVGEVVAKLPFLSLEQLQELGGLEQVGKSRQGILGPIADMLLTRANSEIGGNVDETLKQDQAAANEQ